MLRARRFRFARLAAVPLLAAVAGCVVAPPPPPPPPPEAPALTVSVEVGGLHRPWDIAFAPDGTMLFTEKTGAIHAFVGGAVHTLGGPADIEVLGEAGLMGLAVDPAFTSNRSVFACFLANQGGSRDIRVARWQVDAAYTALSGRTDILTGLPVNALGQAGRHAGCRTRFGPDGYLWVTAGDAATGTFPQDPASLGGKVLRVDRDGAPAAGNAGPPFRPEIYNYGHRNAQGLAFRPADGMAFAVEHGPTCDDEVNVMVAGANYGWNPVPTDGSVGYNESVPMTDLAAFPGAKVATWSSGCPTIATSGAGFVTGAQWKAWDGALVVAALKGAQLRILSLDAAGAVVAQAGAVTDQGRLRVAVQGPDGDLFVAQDADPGAILRVHPA